MKNLVYVLLFICLQSYAQTNKSTYLDQYNLTWQGASANSSESMPLGGGDIGCNVWVEKGEVLFYIGSSGAFDENNALLKLGRIRLSVPTLFTKKSIVKQTLHLKEGYIHIDIEENSAKAAIKLWVDVLQPVVRIEVVLNEAENIKISYENWRNEIRSIAPDHRHPCLAYQGYPGEVLAYPDVVKKTADGSLLFYHRNRNDALVITKEFEAQKLSELLPTAFNPLQNRTFGGMLTGSNLTFNQTVMASYLNVPHQAWEFKSKNKAKKHEVDLVLQTSQPATAAEYEKELSMFASIAQQNREIKKSEDLKWWATLWDRSKILINKTKDKEDRAWQIGRNYHLFRYMLACNAYGAFPTKFNGGLFTTDPQFINGIENENADYRQWGGGSFTAQNQRHVYWPMLKNGDCDFCFSQFDLYLNTLQTNKERTKKLWGHGGTNYTEHLNNYGIPLGDCYGWENSLLDYSRRSPEYPLDQLHNPWVEYHYSSQLEFAYMILEYYRFSKRDISKYIPFIEEATLFFDEHYRYQYKKSTGKEVDEQGKLVIFPSTALETYKNATNPVDVVAGLHVIVDALLTLPDNYISAAKKQQWQLVKQRLPELTIGEINGHRTILPARTWSHKQNVEIPQLYALFPFPMYGLTKPDLDLVLNTWKYGDIDNEQRSHVSWTQGGIFTARMGLTEEAKVYAEKKLGDSGRRFPAFWGPGHDWVPDHNWGGSGMVGLQEMLLQTDGKELLLFPAWPSDWNVVFKLNAPENTIIEGELFNGKLIQIKVTPESRTRDLRILLK